MPDQIADDIREFIWDIGNGTTEVALCDSLEQFFHILCPLANLLDEQVCVDFKVG
jgi:hypothetical protein